MVWLPDCKKNLNIMFIRSDGIHEHDKQTDGQTYRQTPHDGIGRSSIASRCKSIELANLPPQPRPLRIIYAYMATCDKM